MKALSSSDFELFSHSIERLYQCQDIDTFPRHVVGVVGGLLQGNFVSYTEVNPIRNRAIAIVEPRKFDVDSLAGVFMKYSHQHPLIDYYQRTGDGRAAKISDFLNPTDWHRTDIYQLVYKPIDVEDQLSITLPAPPPVVVGIIVSRPRRDFTERDRTLFNAFRPHMVAAYEIADRVSRLQGDAATLSEAVESMSVGLVRVTGKGEIKFISPRARHWLGRHFPQPTHPDTLPEALDQWLLGVHEAAEARKASPAITPMRVESSDEVLEIRWKALGEDDLLLLEAHPRIISNEPLVSLGLTRREAEVLHWASEGKTNPEIAIILGMGSRTVQKHMERIFQKLNVQTRTAAARMAIETRRSGPTNR